MNSGAITASLFGCFLAMSAIAADTEPLPPAEIPARISPATQGRHGFIVHQVECAFQGKTEIQVLLPNKIPARKRVPTLYLLPVEAGTNMVWGDPMQEARKLDLANKLNVICVYPTFSHLPWYVDHPTDKSIQQETYFLKVVVPFIESHYPAKRERDGRLLLGFSKSGWGAWSLLLRHPDTFGRAAAWDAPLALERGQYGLETIAGTQENFEQYRIFTLLKKQADALGPKPRLALMGHGNFQNHTRQTHDLMRSLKIAHEFRDGPDRKHHWNSGWVIEGATWLLK